MSTPKSNHHLMLQYIKRESINAPVLTSLGYLPDSSQQIDKAHPSDNFSIILRGHGFVTIGDRSWNVHAPCIFHQACGERIAYGPIGQWDELFLCYGPQQRHLLTQHGWWSEVEPVWNMPDLSEWRNLVDTLLSLLTCPLGVSLALACDHIGKALLDCTVVDVNPVDSSRSDKNKQLMFDRIAQDIYENIASEIDFAHIASECDLSQQHFRRIWRKRFGMSPDQWLQKRRMHIAAHHISSGHSTIKEIAQQVGYQDAQYFSRVFKSKYGCSPRQFRQSNQRE